MKNIKQKPITKLIFLDKKEEKIKIIPKNKIPQTNICGILMNDSKNIPDVKEAQRKNNILDEVISEAVKFFEACCAKRISA
jgi:hypothetical protein